MHIGDNQEETRRYGPLAQSVELCTYGDKVMQGSRVRFSEGPRFIVLDLKQFRKPQGISTSRRKILVLDP